MKNKVTIILAIIILIIVGMFFWKSLGGLSYKVGNQRGHSKSIIESKERKVFLKKLNTKFIPNDIKVNCFSAFIEKGFRYGENNMDKTESLGHNEYPFQLIVSYKKNKGDFRDTIIVFDNEIHSLQGYKPLRMSKLKDTIEVFMLYNRSMYEVDTLGVVKLWE